MSATSDILTKYTKVAVVGLSPKPDRPSHKVAEYLIDHDYEVVGVRPGVDTILGVPVYDSLLEAKQPVEIVDVFRSPEHVPKVVEAAIRVGAKALWLQEGVSHPEAEARAREAGMEVVSDLCMLKEHQKLLNK